MGSHLHAGSEDGLIRLLNVQPNRVFGVVQRDPMVKEPSSIERIALSCNKDFLVCAAHENAVQICDLRFLKDQGQQSDDETQQVGVLIAPCHCMLSDVILCTD